jgi:hypothetical protein
VCAVDESCGIRSRHLSNDSTGTRKKIASRRLGRLLTRYEACSLSRCQEMVEDSIRDTAFETATSGAVKPETLSGKNSAQGRFFSRC